MRRTDVFVSYVNSGHPPNQTFVSHLQQECQRQAGPELRVRIDQNERKPGQASEFLEGMLDECGSFVPLICDGWFESSACRFELVTYLRKCRHRPVVVPALVGTNDKVEAARRRLEVSRRPPLPVKDDDVDGIVNYIASLRFVTVTDPSTWRDGQQQSLTELAELLTGRAREDEPDHELGRAAIEKLKSRGEVVEADPGTLNQAFLDGLPDGATVALEPRDYTGPLDLERGIGLWSPSSSETATIRGEDRKPAVVLRDRAWVGGLSIHAIGKEADGVVCGQGAGGIYSCEIVSRKGVAVRVVDSTEARILGNRIHASAFGFAIGGYSSPHVTGNLIESIQHCAIDVHEDALPVLTANYIERVFGVGILIRDHADPRLVRVVITGATKSGIELRKGACVRIEDSEIARSGRAGLWCAGDCDLQNVLFLQNNPGISLESGEVSGGLVEFHANQDCGARVDVDAVWSVEETRCVDQPKAVVHVQNRT